jgi:tRNA(fMet)-specific endonuclease VapC
VTFLLDTNPCIVYLNGRSLPLRGRVDSVGDENIVVCSVVRAELLFGAAKSQSPQKTALAQEAFLGRFDSLPFDDSAARAYGPIRAELERAGATIGAHDLLIAAIAIANDLILVTHNTGEFGRIPGLVTQDWEIAATASR